MNDKFPHVQTLSPRVWVLGGTGFIGRHLVAHLCAEGAKVTVTTSRPQTGGSLVQSKTNRIEYTESSFVQFLDFNSFDQIYFLSGNSSPHSSSNDAYLDIEKTNIPLICLLEALRKSRYKGTLWFASSVAVYGSVKDQLLKEDSVCNPLSFYGVSKLAGEETCKFYSRVYGLNAGIFRIFSTFGPGLSRQLVFDIIEKFHSPGENVNLFGNGDEQRDLGYVIDQARALAFVSQKIVPRGDIINIGTGHAFRISEVVDEIRALIGSKKIVHYSGETRPFDGYSWCADTSKLQALGFEWKYNLRQGLAETISAFG